VCATTTDAGAGSFDVREFGTFFSSGVGSIDRSNLDPSIDRSSAHRSIDRSISILDRSSILDRPTR
jgi:hypothetical protein